MLGTLVRTRAPCCSTFCICSGHSSNTKSRPYFTLRCTRCKAFEYQAVVCPYGYESAAAVSRHPLRFTRRTVSFVLRLLLVLLLLPRTATLIPKGEQVQHYHTYASHLWAETMKEGVVKVEGGDLCLLAQHSAFCSAHCPPPRTERGYHHGEMRRNNPKKTVSLS